MGKKIDYELTGGKNDGREKRGREEREKKKKKWGRKNIRYYVRGILPPFLGKEGKRKKKLGCFFINNLFKKEKLVTYRIKMLNPE